MERNYKIGIVALTSAALAGCLGVSLQDHGPNSGRYFERDKYHQEHCVGKNSEAKPADAETRQILQEVASQGDSQAQLTHQSEQNVAGKKQALEEAHAVDQQVNGVSNYIQVSEFRLTNVVTHDDQSDKKGSYIELDKVEGAERVFVRVGSEERQYKTSDLETVGGKWRVYVEDLPSNELGDGIEFTFYGQGREQAKPAAPVQQALQPVVQVAAEQEDGCFICPGIQPIDPKTGRYTHPNAEEEARHVEEQDKQAFLDGIAQEGKKVSQAMDHFGAQAVQRFTEYRTAHEGSLRAEVTGLVREGVTGFKGSLEARDAEIQSTLGSVEQVRAKNREWAEHLRAELKRGGQ